MILKLNIFDKRVVKNMSPTFRKSTSDTKTISFTVRYQDAFDIAIVAAYFAELGLTTTELLQAFERQKNGFTTNNSFYRTFAEATLAELYSDKNWYAKALTNAKKSGFANITFHIPVVLFNEIIVFLASSTAREIIDRVKDTAHQGQSGLKDALTGAKKNIEESLKDSSTAINNLASGTFDTLLSPVGSDRFKKGFSRAGLGASQSFNAYNKGTGQTLFDFLLTLGLKQGSAYQTFYFLESIGRPPDPAEKQVLQQVFAGSVEYDAIRIKTGYAGFLSAGNDGGWTLLNNNRAITIGNTIYMKNTPYNTAPASDWLSTLVHETTHVWQHQNGGTDYMGEALYAQEISNDGYGYADAITKNPPRTWFLLNPEQQGQLIQDAYINEFFHNGGWSNVKPVLDSSKNVVPPQTLINFMNQVIPQLRAGQGAT